MDLNIVKGRLAEALAHRFAAYLLASAALILAVMVVSGFAAAWFLERALLSREEAEIVQVVRGHALEHLAPADFEKPRSLVNGKAFGTFLRALPGIFRVKVFDRTGRIVWSDEARLIGQRFPDNPYFDRALKGQVTMVLEAPKRTEHVYERTRRYVSETYVPVTFPGSLGVVGVIETYRDVSEVVSEIRRAQRVIWGATGGGGLLLYVALAWIVWRARVNELRAVSHLEAQEKMAALGRLAAGIAHEVRNPLTIITGRVGLLKSQISDGQHLPVELLSRHLASLEEATERMGRIMQGLSTYSKPRKREQGLLNIGELLSATRELMSHEARKNQVTISVDTPASLPRVPGDRSQLMQVLVNLATNAIEAMAETGGQLMLRASVQNDEPNRQGPELVRLEITDTGPGIPPEALGKIWEPFYTSKPDGTGLGLSIVRSLVTDQPGVRIDVRSTPGRGTTFVLTLPVNAGVDLGAVGSGSG